MIPVVQGLLHRVAHVSPTDIMACNFAFFKIHVSGVITTFNREHPSILRTQHIHLHWLLLIIELILHLYLLLMSAASLRHIIDVAAAVIACLISRLLYDPLSVEVHGQIF